MSVYLGGACSHSGFVIIRLYGCTNLMRADQHQSDESSHRFATHNRNILLVYNWPEDVAYETNIAVQLTQSDTPVQFLCCVGFAWAR